MKVIELLTKIANEEEAPLIKYRDKILHWNKEKDRFEDKDGMNTLYEMNFSELNDEAEIIEEDKKIEKIEYEISDDDGDFTINGFAFDYEQKLQIIDKINEIIEFINDRND